MMRSIYQPTARMVGTVVTIAVVALAGCQRQSEPAASAPAVDPAPMSAAHPAAAAPAEGQPASSASSIKVTVSLSPAIAGKAAPNDAVFIFARAANGPRMPLAVARKSVKDLPATVVLDDSLAMSPAMKLSSVPEAIVVARVSKTGDAMAQAGDLEGASGPVKTGNGAVAVSISKVVTGQ